MTWPSSMEAARNLDDALIEPLQPYLQGIERLIVSPDAQLNFVPFAALLNGDGQFLAERYEVGYVAGGRDLVKEPAGLSKVPPLLVGGPSYRVDVEVMLAESNIAGTLKRDVRTDDIASLEFMPLPAAELEAGRVEASLGDARVLTCSDATEAVVRSIKSPQCCTWDPRFFPQGDRYWRETGQ